MGPPMRREQTKPKGQRMESWAADAGVRMEGATSMKKTESIFSKVLLRQF